MKKILLALSLVFLFGFISWRSSLEAQKVLSFPVNSWTEDHSADCAVVLTGEEGRVAEGFSLLAQKRIKKLIISGVYPGARLREIFPQIPFYGSVNFRDVILEKRSMSTFGNAQQSLPLVEALNCRDVILVTSSLHMYRALQTFKGVFPEKLSIYPRAIISSGSVQPKVGPVAAETIKSLFYSLWAY